MPTTITSLEEPEVAFIEEQVDTGLGELISGYRSELRPTGFPENRLSDNFVIDVSRPVPQFQHRFALAFAAHDENTEGRELVALALDPSLPHRVPLTQETAGKLHPALQLPIAAGTVHLSALGESRHVLLVEPPGGTRLSEVLATGRLSDYATVERVLIPAVQALLAMREKGLSHGHIHSGNFYIGTPSSGTVSMLGECFSSPSGALSSHVYQGIERLGADVMGRGDGDEKADSYALGVLALECIAGLDRVRALSINELSRAILQYGSYQILTNNAVFSDTFNDFFRGVFNDNPMERWGLAELEQWIGGKKFNMIAPSPSKEAARPLQFAGENIFSRRLLAELLRVQWRDAVRDFRTLRIDRWCEMSLHRNDMAEKIDRASRYGSEPGASEKQVNDMMLRVMAVLDPFAPLRTKAHAFRPEGFGQLLVTLSAEKSPELPTLLNLIESDAISFWAEQLDLPKNSEISLLVWRIGRVKNYLRSRALGFGLERTLYELNPTLCCQSPLVKSLHISTVSDLLKALDYLAPALAKQSLVDRHIAAFAAAKLDMSKEIRLADLSKIPLLAEHPELIMIRLLARAQNKYPNLKLVGLATWAGLRIDGLLNEIHNRVIRKRLKLQLKKRAQSGVVRDVLALIVNRDAVSRDIDGFTKAVAIYNINNQHIEYLSNTKVLTYKSRRTGGRIATSISGFILSAVAFYVLGEILHL